MNNSTAVVNGVTYGQWALDNPVCAAQIGGTDFQVLILQLSWVSAYQRIEWHKGSAQNINASRLETNIDPVLGPQSIINACQTFFFATRYPDVGWENIFVPFVEAVVYGLGYSGRYSPSSDARPCQPFLALRTLLNALGGPQGLDMFACTTEELSS
eukprot:3534172-Rhodomonas_salina.2